MREPQLGWSRWNRPNVGLQRYNCVVTPYSMPEMLEVLPERAVLTGVVADDHMIQHFDSKNLTRFDQAFGNISILLAWRGITAGMIVDDRDGMGRLLDCPPKGLSGMHQ